MMTHTADRPRLAPTALITTAVAALLLAVVPPSPLSAQVPGVVGVEARAGGAVGSFTQTGAGLEMAPALSWALSVTWGPSAMIGGYVAYSAVGFRCEGAFCSGYDVSFVSHGFSLGVRGEAQLPGRPWLRAGVLLHDLEQRWGGATPGSETTGASPGFEGAIGATWGLGPRLHLVPGLHLGFLPTRADDGETDHAFFAGLDLGIRLNL
jgi:hypothetical protein